MCCHEHVILFFFERKGTISEIVKTQKKIITADVRQRLHQGSLARFSLSYLDGQELHLFVWLHWFVRLLIASLLLLCLLLCYRRLLFLLASSFLRQGFHLVDFSVQLLWFLFYHALLLSSWDSSLW
eukprot:m.149079 g.149079  ORF g.149079 m.149079 type:complete len:126 (-) comp16149_c11_seq2:944-1321(-)